MKQFITISVLVGLLVFSSCKKTIPFDAKYLEPKLVVNAMLKQDSTATVQISSSKIIVNNSEPQFITNATVSLYKNNEFIENLNLKQHKYVSSNPMEGGAKYTLKVIADNFKEVEAETTIPFRHSISSIRTRTRKNEYDFDVLDFFIEFPTQQNTEDFFLLRTQIHYYPMDEDDKNTKKDEYAEIISEDLIIEGKYKGGILFSNKLMTGNRHTFEGSMSFFKDISDSTLFKFELIKINADMFEYLVSLDQFTKAQGNPMMEPVIVYSNVSSGMGVVGGASYAIDSVTIYKEEQK